MSPDKSIAWLLETYGLLGLGWVIAIMLFGTLLWLARLFVSEQREWRKASEARAQAYHDVVSEIAVTMAKQAAVSDERTREILDLIRHARVRR